MGASCLIKTRMKEVGFPGLFQYYPETMETSELREWNRYALELMNEISFGCVRRCVISDGRYIAAGAAGYLRDLLKSDAADYDNFTDASGRSTYGFFSYVWKKSEWDNRPEVFPSMEAFAGLIREQLLEDWYEPSYSRKAQALTAGISAPFGLLTQTQGTASPATERKLFNTRRDRTRIFYTGHETQILSAALVQAFDTAEPISVCSGAGAPEGSLRETICGNWIVEDGTNPDRTQIIEKAGIRTGGTVSGRNKTGAAGARINEITGSTDRRDGRKSGRVTENNWTSTRNTQDNRMGQRRVSGNEPSSPVSKPNTPRMIVWIIPAVRPQAARQYWYELPQGKMLRSLILNKLKILQDNNQLKYYESYYYDETRIKQCPVLFRMVFNLSECRLSDQNLRALNQNINQEVRNKFDWIERVEAVIQYPDRGNLQFLRKIPDKITNSFERISDIGESVASRFSHNYLDEDESGPGLEEQDLDRLLRGLEKKATGSEESETGAAKPAEEPSQQQTEDDPFAL